ncbi:hypothetical protein ACJQWY_03300 [Weissella kandleri]|uniref:hypothetical protein n=1 Tax=Weissella kandleri TaxID=1616 RepID=UPI00387ED056
MGKYNKASVFVTVFGVLILLLIIWMNMTGYHGTFYLYMSKGLRNGLGSGNYSPFVLYTVACLDLTLLTGHTMSYADLKQLVGASVYRILIFSVVLITLNVIAYFALKDIVDFYQFFQIYHFSEWNIPD